MSADKKEQPDKSKRVTKPLPKWKDLKNTNNELGAAGGTGAAADVHLTPVGCPATNVC